MTMVQPEITIAPLTPERWPDFETLMGPKGGCGGCWCMLWRLRKRDYDAMQGDANRDAIHAVVKAGPPPGLLAYDDKRAVGWISIAPRDAFPRLETSRVMQLVDDRPVWSVSCFLIAKTHRGRGVAVDLLDAACRFAGQHGATVVEGYPVAPLKTPYPDTYAWTGFETVFLRAGFQEVARRSETRPIMRRSL
ncbi:GCN5-related N-acetyltransferase [alpha proteobacterium BAL199]|jgi:GNAT superfamily N-acetyltransferase|nr:GCN5-related N-acetyltransferase [alpha proteobacterium BAL199]